MITVTIDNTKLLVDKRNNIFQICEFLKKEIPRFCYHKELMVAGNCRMCLVEVERMPKPVASCAMPVADNMVIYTNSPLVRKARESVLEFLLINHPLDCPICDQGGECDLQDQSFNYGSDTSRFFYKNKRGVEDKNISVLVKTVMTRCIHCTRCVRFADEIAGLDLLGTTGRGTSTEIGFYIQETFSSELSGNVIDLCPVGALTSKPYAFLARPWELTSFNSIDINDAIGAHIKVDVCNNNVVRISPQNCWEINDSWISDKARFYFDGLKYQKISKVFFNAKNQNWLVGLNFLIFTQNLLKAKKFKLFNFQFITGETVNTEALEIVQNLSYKLGQGNISSVASKKINLDLESNYVFNSNFIDFETTDVALIISTNLRYEAPNLNIKLKKNTNLSNPSIYYLGTYFKNTFDMKHIGISLNILKKIVEGKHKLARILIKAKSPKIIVGTKNNLTENFNNFQLMFNLLNKKLNKNVINQLSLHASSVGAMSLGIPTFRPRKGSQINYLLDVDKITPLIQNSFKNSYISINQHFQGNEYADSADILFPNSSIFEKKGTFVNLIGQKQTTTRSIFNKHTSYNEIEFLNHVVNGLIKTNSVSTNSNFITTEKIIKTTNYKYFNFLSTYNTTIVLESNLFDNNIKNFYNTNTIANLSPTMHKTSKQVLNNKNFI